MSDTDVARLEAKVDAIRHRLDALLQDKKAGLTVVDFAKAAGIGRSTVHRLFKAKKLYKKNGRIPYELLKPFVS